MADVQMGEVFKLPLKPGVAESYLTDRDRDPVAEAFGTPYETIGATATAIRRAAALLRAANTHDALVRVAKEAKLLEDYGLGKVPLNVEEWRQVYKRMFAALAAPELADLLKEMA